MPPRMMMLTSPRWCSNLSARRRTAKTAMCRRTITTITSTIRRPPLSSRRNDVRSTSRWRRTRRPHSPRIVTRRVDGAEAAAACAASYQPFSCSFSVVSADSLDCIHTACVCMWQFIARTCNDETVPHFKQSCLSGLDSCARKDDKATSATPDLEWSVTFLLSISPCLLPVCRGSCPTLQCTLNIILIFSLPTVLVRSGALAGPSAFVPYLNSTLLVET